MAAKNKKEPKSLIENKTVLNPVWLTVSEAAKVMGANTKTVRRAIQEQVVKYKIVGERYFIDFTSLLILVHSRKKLINKFKEFGFGQYVEKWRNEKYLTLTKSNAPVLPEDQANENNILDQNIEEEILSEKNN